MVKADRFVEVSLLVNDFYIRTNKFLPTAVKTHFYPPFVAVKT